MPYSFTKIEEDKTKTIRFVFFFLIAFYFFTFWAIALVIKNYALFQDTSARYHASFSWLGLRDTVYLLLLSAAVGYCHWQYTVTGLINKVLRVLKAEPLNPKDSYHTMFRNIIDEVSVATGGRVMEGAIVPTAALNAFSLADFNGRAVIGVTEGLLARLSRAQLEAVVGHEAAHIVSGDCLATTVTTSIFELYSAALKGFELMLRGGARAGGSYRSSSRGGSGAALILLIYLLLAVTRALSQMIRMFVSRQREYRADAVAARLTRDPLSLAEALYGIAYHWRGAGLNAQEMGAIFMVNPKLTKLDESEGIFSDLFSTHPPVENRINILLNMAHASLEEAIANVKKKENQPRVLVPDQDEQKKWMVVKDGEFTGPFELVQMATFDWLKPNMWVKQIGTDKIQMAKDDTVLTSYLSKDSQNGSTGLCPRCHLALSTIIYEGVDILKCMFCKGVLVDAEDVKRIILRQEVGFSDRIERIARQIIEDDNFLKGQKINRDPKTLLTCPKCNDERGKMNRMFYTTAYKVEIDQCFWCGSVWFDADELAVLQCCIEMNVKEG